MGLFSKKKKDFDITKPVTNPGLKSAISIFNQTKTEANLNSVITFIKTADFLVLIYTDGLVTKPGEDGKTVFEKGSTFKFLTTFNENKEQYLPIFTDWQEIDLWVTSRENLGGWIMTAKEIFDFVLMQPAYKGIVINLMSDRWQMTSAQIDTFVKEVY